MSYQQLTLLERYQIQALNESGINQKSIAHKLGRDPSTISRELKRNLNKSCYCSVWAHTQTQHRKQNKSPLLISDDQWDFVESLIKSDWSPEQISLWLAENKSYTVSHEWIYQYIYQEQRDGGHLWQHLRCQKQRRKRYGSPNTRGQIPNRKSIHNRPDIVESRERIGDWELDTVIGKGHKQALVTLTERKSRYTLIKKVSHKTADQVSKAITSLLRPFQNKVLTLTSDNGKEFAKHQQMEKALDAEFYFADPYASWQRGLNENTNGLIRQYFPKDRDFRTIKQKEVDFVTKRLNNRPRKCLGIKTPNQVFLGINPKIALES